MKRKSVEKLFPSNYKKLLFQQKTAQKLLNAFFEGHRGAILGDGVGMGKTYTSLFTALAYMANRLHKHKANKQDHTSLLIIAPNTLVLNKWIEEIKPFAKPENVSTYIERSKNTRYKDTVLRLIQNILTAEDLKHEAFRLKWSIIMLTKQQINNVKGKKLEALKKVVSFIIFDEAHHLREPKVIEAFNNELKELMLGNGDCVPKFLLLTATPFQKNIEQLKIFFKEKYFLDKRDAYEDLLDKYIKPVREYLKSGDGDYSMLKKKRGVIQEKLKPFFIVNRKKSNKPPIEFINATRIKHGGNPEGQIEKARELFEKKKVDGLNLKSRLNNFEKAYLVYRFGLTAKKKKKQKVDGDLCRFTSFPTFHCKELAGDESKKIKLDILEHIVKKFFKPHKNHWNRKFIVFCGDMLNADPKKNDNKLHEALATACQRGLQFPDGGVFQPIDPPNFEEVIKGEKKKWDDHFNESAWLSRLSRTRRRGWEKKFKKSRLYSFYGPTIKKYYEERFCKEFHKHCCLSYLKDEISITDLSGLTSSKKRKNRFDEILKQVAEHNISLSYTIEGLENMWKQFIEEFDTANNSKIRKNNIAKKARKKFSKHLSNESARIWKAWEHELPGDKMVETYSGSSRNYNSLRRFQSPLEPFAFVLGKAGEEGIDLQAFSKGVINYDFDWRPGNMLQRQGRVDRLNKATDKRGVHAIFKEKRLFNRYLEKEPVQIHYLLIPHTYDERKFYRMRERQYLFNLLIPTNLENESLHCKIKKKRLKGLDLRLGRTVKM